MEETPFRPTISGVITIFEEAETLFAQGNEALVDALSQQLTARDKLSSVGRDLTTREAELAVSGKITGNVTGKNAEERKAAFTVLVSKDSEYQRLLKEQRRWQDVHDKATLDIERAKARMAAGRARSSMCIQLLGVMAGSSAQREAAPAAS